MQKIDENHILAGLAWLLFAMGFGIWTGLTGATGMGIAHAHAALGGFAASMLFGLTCRLFPAMRSSKMAKPQFWIYQLGTVLMVAGDIRLAMSAQNDLMAFGSVVVLCGAALFALMFVQNRQLRLPG